MTRNTPQPDLFRQPRQASTETRAAEPPIPSKAVRDALWAAWLAEGEPWPPPAGVLSGALDACMAGSRWRTR